MSLFAQAKGYEKTAKIWENRRVSPCFAIFYKNSCTLQYNGKDIEEAEEKLQNFFNESEGSDYGDQIFEFRMYSEPKKQYDKKDAAHSTFFFTVNERPAAMSGMQNGAPKNDYFLHNIAGELSAIRSELNALKAEKINEENEEEEEEQPENEIGEINQLLSNPVIAGLIGAVTEKFFNVKAEPKIITNLAGVPEDNERAACYQYVEILLQKGVKPEHLKKLADMPTAKIKTLLMML
jgi:hypothetical protein